ncbi:MAG: dTDP-4-dehydrorhamnose reductase [Flavobacteriaceae bacterium]|nr:dTDP-4-dehydrorhamnose reductase [Flavobacteriaceae bacterium]MDZ4146990.1 dTDP-4-dehydrorhamnose reductase [Flavobacteriaceae bacterium]
MKRILITGADGQLGQCLRKVVSESMDCVFLFENRISLDITNNDAVFAYFNRQKLDFCINTAAFTQVDLAECHQKEAYKINVEGVKNLIEACEEFRVKLIHLSTDFVFDGAKKTPYLETDLPKPQTYYGQTKLEAEEWIQHNLQAHYILRTSWLYSEYGHNFMKTMLRLANEKKKIRVVNDQFGSPTSAADLAKAILTIVDAEKNHYGLYHFSNSGETTWYGFAKEIFRQQNLAIDLEAIQTSDFPTAAARPNYSVLNSSKFSKTFQYEVQSWQNALQIVNKSL